MGSKSPTNANVNIIPARKFQPSKPAKVQESVVDDWEADEDHEEDAKNTEDTDDPWERERNTNGTTTTTNAARRAVSKAPDGIGADQNLKLWEKANKEAPTATPMLAASSTSIRSLPPGALAPSLSNGAPQILRRPSPATSDNARAEADGKSAKTLQQREAEYQAARARIFGSPAPASADGAADAGADIEDRARKTATNSRSPRGTPGRAPRGPQAGSEGFKRDSSNGPR